MSEPRKVIIEPPVFEDMEKAISEIPYVRDSAHLELFYNLIYNDQGFVLPDHLRPVTAALADTKIYDLMVIISPGAGKSYLSDVVYPLYEFGLDQNTTIMGISSGADLMIDYLQTTMEMIESNKIYKLLFPSIKPDTDAGWSTARGIFVKRTITGIASPTYQSIGYNSKKITGKHSKILVVDDLHDEENCLDNQTEVLTKRGWLLFKDTNKEDWFATRHPETHQFEWQQPIKLIEQDYDGELIYFNSRGLDLMVTPNHRMIISHRTSQKSELILRADELETKSDRCIPVTSNWMGKKIDFFNLEPDYQPNHEIGWKKTNSKTRSELRAEGLVKGGHLRTESGYTDCLICNREFYHSPYRNTAKFCSKECSDKSHINKIQLSGDYYCAFMGMYLSEGYVLNNGKTIGICQESSGKGFNEFEALLEYILGYKPKHDGHQWTFNSVLLNKYLIQYGKDATSKFIPDIIKNSTTDQIEIFLRYYSLGDGHCGYSPDGTYKDELYTSSKQIADDLQELYQKTGYFASIKTKINNKQDKIICGRLVKAENMHDSYTITRHISRFDHNPKNYVSVRKSERVLYKGKVYCTSVPNQTLYVRRNGYAAWVGNSSSGEALDKVENFYYRTLLGRKDPMGSRMIMIGRRWAEDDLYGRLKKSGDWLVMTLASIRETPELYYDVRIPAGLSCIFNNFEAKNEVEDIKVVYGENRIQRGFYWKHDHSSKCPPNCPGMVSKYKEALTQKKNKPTIFETVYQSNPEIVGSKIFNKEDFIDFEIPDAMHIGRNYDAVASFIGRIGFDMIIQAWDTAFTAETRNDPSCGLTVGLKGCEIDHKSIEPDAPRVPFHYDLYILDEYYKHIQMGDLEEEAVTYFNLWQPNYVIVENAAAGIPLIQNLQKYSINVIPVTVQHTSKRGRAINGANAGSAQGWAKQGRVFVSRKAEWAEGFLNELDSFTGAKGKRDDQADAFIHACNFAIDYGVQSRELPPGWRTEEEINERLKQMMYINHPLMQLPYLYQNVQNPLYGLCATCKMFENNYCKLHKRKITKLETCPFYQPTEESIMSVDPNGRIKK